MAYISSGGIICLVILNLICPSDPCPVNCKSASCNEADNGCPKCNEGWFGRQCEHALECYTGRGFTYNGTMAVTVNNVACQYWSSQTPIQHDWASLSKSENYCRNPNIHGPDDRPWCYQQEGNRYAQCNIPKCEDQCPPPTLPVFGDVIDPPPKGFSIGTVVQVVGSCGPGQQGHMTCRRDKTWSSATSCTAIPWCSKPSLAEPKYISSSQSAFHFNESLRIFCRNGYELLGKNVIFCQEHKTWSRVPTCTRVFCADPVMDKNSYITSGIRASYKYSDTVHVACLMGFDIVGQTKFECQANRQWNGTFPVCEAYRCPDPELNDNSFIQNMQFEYIYRDVITVGCLDGYTLQGESNFSCDVSKTWNGTFPHCKAVPCEKPTLPERTLMNSSKDVYIFKDEIELTCVEGYEIKHNNVIRCQANMTWGLIPTCTVVECKPPMLEPNGVILYGRKPSYIYKDSIVLGCKIGNYLSSTIKTSTCLSSGKWQEIDLKCSAYSPLEDAEASSQPSVVMTSIGISVVSVVLAVIAVAMAIYNIIRFRRNINSTRKTEKCVSEGIQENHYEDLNVTVSGKVSGVYSNIKQ